MRDGYSISGSVAKIARATQMEPGARIGVTLSPAAPVSGLSLVADHMAGTQRLSRTSWAAPMHSAEREIVREIAAKFAKG